MELQKTTTRDALIGERTWALRQFKGGKMIVMTTGRVMHGFYRFGARKCRR